MKYRKNLVALFLGISSLTYAQKHNNTEVYEIVNSEFRISGTSNITEYECLLLDQTDNREIEVISEYIDEEILLQNANISLKSSGFDCKNGKLTNDFLKSIKAEIYEYIHISFLGFRLNELVEVNAYQEDVTAYIKVELAGVSNNYKTNLDYIKFEKDKFTLKGSKQLYMTEFEISPPKALFGLVQADNMVEIDFVLTFVLK